jgi:hypothetical protein
MVAYAVDRLGWLQFQQLCTGLLELDGGLPSSAWAGTADACRRAHSQTALGPPLSANPLPEPVLVHCAWIRPGSTSVAVEAAIAQLASRHPEDIALARSYLLLSNVAVDAQRLRLVTLEPRLTLATLGPQALSERIDALPELRLAMPSLLGLRALDGLIDREVQRRSSLHRPDAETLAAVFVPTRAYWRALEVLRHHHFAVLTGPPEMGKTAIARMVGLAQMTAGWEAHECTDPDAVWRVLDPARPQIFIADDAFGSTEYRAVAAERWATAMERLLRTLDDRHWLIWTSRPAPLHAALRRLHRERGAERFPAPGRVLVDAGDLSVGEKTLILFRHAKAADLPEPVRLAVRHHGVAILAEEHFTPERIRRLVGRLRAGETDLRRIATTELTTPTEAMATSYDTLSAEHRDLLLALLDAPPGPVAERELVAALRRHHDGSLSTAPVELVDRLADHFLRVLT